MADVILNVTIPEAVIPRVLNAFTKIADTHMTIEARGSSPDPANDFDARWDFRIAAKGATETNKDFGQRVLRELGKAVVNMVDKQEDELRYRTQVAAVVPPASDIPDNILT